MNSKYSLRDISEGLVRNGLRWNSSLLSAHNNKLHTLRMLNSYSHPLQTVSWVSNTYDLTFETLSNEKTLVTPCFLSS